MEHSGKVQLWPLAGVTEISTDARKTGVGNRGQVRGNKLVKTSRILTVLRAISFLKRRSRTGLHMIAP